MVVSILRAAPTAIIHPVHPKIDLGVDARARRRLQALRLRQWKTRHKLPW